MSNLKDAGHRHDAPCSLFSYSPVFFFNLLCLLSLLDDLCTSDSKDLAWKVRVVFALHEIGSRKRLLVTRRITCYFCRIFSNRQQFSLLITGLNVYLVLNNLDQ